MLAQLAGVEEDAGPEPPGWLSVGKDWLGFALTGLWIGLLALAIVAPMAGLVSTLQTGPKAPEADALKTGTGSIAQTILTVGLAFNGDTGRIVLVPATAEASRAGVKIGDEIVAIDGRPVSSADTLANEEALADELAGPDGSSVRLTVQRATAGTAEITLTRHNGKVAAAIASAGVNSALFRWLNALTIALPAGLLIAAAVLLFRQRKAQWLAYLLSFTFLMIAAGSTSYLYLIYGYSGAANFLTIEGLTFLTLVVFLFPNGRFAFRWAKWAALITLVWGTLSATSVTQRMMFALGHGNWNSSIPAAGQGFRLLAVIALIARYQRLRPGPQRQQLRWAILGFVAGAVLLVPARVFEAIPEDAASLGSILWLRPSGDLLTALALVLFAGGLLISLLRYRLYDADAVITRSVSIGALTVIFLALFAGTEKIIELLGEEWFGERLGILAGGIGAALAAAMIVPLHHRLNHWAEHKFQKELIRLRTGLPLLVGDMREAAPVTRIAAATLDSVGHGVRSTRSGLLFEGALIDARGIEAEQVEGWLKGWSPAIHDGFDIDKADPLFPLRVPLEALGHGRIGWLLLGPRPDGSFYGKDERETLAEIADPVARALEIAAAREKRESDERELWQDQRALNQQLLRASEESIRVFSEVARKLDQLLAPPGMAAE